MKKLLIAAGVLAAAFIIAAVILITSLDSLITKAINTYGPEITGTDVRTEGVRVSFLSGEAAVKNFLLGNTKGFRSAHAMKAASINVDLELGSLLGDTIVVKRIEVTQPDIIYEKRGGTDNFKTIARHAGQKAKGTGLVSGEAEKEESGKKLLIRDFIIRGGRVTLYTPDLPSGTASAAIPDMHLKNIGMDGAPPEKVFSQILSALHDH
jgi:uncharacterized protein involved in outer membrane biogenesis